MVLDGETLALQDDGRPRPFQETASRFGADTHELLLRPFFFDCLHLDGVDLIDEPLSARLEALERAVGAHRMPGVLRPSGRRGRRAAGAGAGGRARGRHGQGARQPVRGGPAGRAWQKVKPVHTLDLVVLGAEWGYGRRTGTLSNIHLGARDPDGGEPIMVGKTFKGMTDALLAWQTETFPQYARERSAATRCCCAPSWWWRSSSTACSAAPATPAASRCGSPGSCATGPDKTAAEADTIDAVRALLPARTPDGGAITS